MKRRLNLLIAFACVAIFSMGIVSTSWASKPSEAERFEIFLKTEGLRKKLALTDEQVERLKVAVENSYFPHGREGKPPVTFTDEEMFQEDKKFFADIYKILTAEQKKQVQLYKFQLNGGLDTKSVYTTKWEILDLSEEQVKTLQKLEMERSAKYDALMKEVDFKNKSREEAKAAMEKIQKPFADISSEYNAKMKGVLNEKQLELGKKLTEEGKGLRKEVGLPDSDH